jgi:hypothetical protein
MSSTTAPVETKVAAGAVSSWATGVVTWLLVTYVFHGQLPDQLTTFLPYVVASICGTAAAYMAKHTPRLEEVAAEVAQVVTGNVPGHAGNLPPLPPAPATGQPAA